MPAIVLVGAQWGDEGKGKATDLLGSGVDYVVKFNGGNNAGHTIVDRAARSTRCTCCPSGILTPACTPVIGNGVVVDLAVLFEEIDGARGARRRHLPAASVSANAHVIAPYHRTLDKVTERFLGVAQDRHHRARHRPDLRRQDEPRRHPRAGPVRRERSCARRSRRALELKNQLLVKVYNRRAIEVDEVVEELLAYAERLRPMVADTSLLLDQALDDGKTVLFEGGQATLLDVDHGTYPFVTSSNADRGRRLHRLRHPADPDRPGHRDRQGLHHPRRRGAVPDRAARRRRASACARRAPSSARRPAARAAAAGSTPSIARYATRVNGVTDFVLTKLDVLTGLETGPGLRRLRRRRRAPRRDADEPDRLPPRRADLRGARRLVGGHLRVPHLRRPAGERPGATSLRVEELIGARISAIGVGPGRDETIERHSLLGLD